MTQSTIATATTKYRLDKMWWLNWNLKVVENFTEIVQRKDFGRRRLFANTHCGTGDEVDDTTDGMEWNDLAKVCVESRLESVKEEFVH